MTSHFSRTAIILVVSAVTVCACGGLPRPLSGSGESTSQLTETTCTDAFVPHPLDFVTSVRGDAVHMFESNGAGVAVDDLDDDGDLDIVLANLGGPNAVLWNEGGLVFRKQEFPNGDSRAVAIVDVDGDGLRDVVFTSRLGAPAWWRNTGKAKTSEVSEDLGGLSFARVAPPGRRAQPAGEDDVP